MPKNNVQEREIENLLEQYLKEKHYIYDFGNPNRNVYMQSPKTEEEFIILEGKRPDYMIYLYENETKPNIIIETKKPNMNLIDTLEQALGYAKKLKSEIVIIFDGITLKSFFVKKKEELKIDGIEVKEILEIEQYKEYIRENTSNLIKETTLEIKSKQDLISVFAFANNKLRKAGIQKGIERFTEFTNLLFLKLISEENDVITENIPQHIKWDSYKNKTGDELYSYINNIVITELENIFNRQKEDSLFTKLMIRDKKSLKQIINKLDQLNLSGIETDIKGDAFEYFIQKYNSNNKDLGEYFTPRHIVNFLVELANITYGEKVYDPFCGTGGVLISAFNILKKQLQDKNIFTETVKIDLKESTFFGSEISTTAKVSKMNMILTGDGHSNIIQQNTLLNAVEGLYDVVISNIPFNLEVDKNELYYTHDTTDGNSQCIEHIMKSLNNTPTARAFIIIPEGFLNNSASKNTRKKIIDNNLLRGIISLPVGVFLPYADAKTSILVLQGFNNIPIDKVFYYKVKNDGYTLTTRRRKKDGINDLDEFKSISYENLQYIPYDKIKKDENYSLLYFRYDKSIPTGHIKFREIIRETNIKNEEEHPTASITNSEFYGITLGEDYWGENFISVTSKTNEKYKVIRKNDIGYNPSRINIGSIGINTTNQKVAVSSAYVTFEVFNNDFLPEFVYLYLKSKKGKEEIITRCFGSVRQSLNFYDLLDMGIPQVDKERQEKICSNARKKYELYMKAKNTVNNFDLFNTDI